MSGREENDMYRIPQGDLLAGLLRQSFDRERAEAVVHALVDIAESMETLYGTLLPELVSVLDQASPVFKDKLWDIREEFRHIAYHIEDAKLTEL